MEERNQKLRTLQAEYLKLRWKINKYEKYVSMFGNHHGEVFKDRIRRKLDGFRSTQTNIWNEICLMHKV